MRQLLAREPTPQDVTELQGPQGAHRPVFTARFPLQGALQTLPVIGREPDTQRSPQTTPPRELLTPANPKGLVKILGGQVSRIPDDAPLQASLLNNSSPKEVVLASCLTQIPPPVMPAHSYI